MDEKLDIYCDQFQVNSGPFGCALNFAVSKPEPPAPGKTPEVDRVATIRMSLEHLKTMVFILRRQLLEQEEKAGVKIELPIRVLNALSISKEDWDTFWK